MAETRYIRNFDIDGNELEPTPYEVFDEQLHREALDKEANERSHAGLAAFNNYDNLTVAQKDAILKNLLWYVLYKEGLL